MNDWRGALAQLGERYNGIVEVSGSIPLGSTSHNKSRFNDRTLADEYSSAGVFRVYGSPPEKVAFHFFSSGNDRKGTPAMSGGRGEEVDV